jgi:glycosyltransferase involved in cell wall biosynthesis
LDGVERPIEFLVYGLDPNSALGAYGYSWVLAQRSFLPILRRIAPVREIVHPESSLDYWAREARLRGRLPIAVSFRPFQDAYISRLVPTVSYCFWEFPDIPRETLFGNPRYDWARMARESALILCGSSCAEEAFRKAGVKTPVCVVPPPLSSAWEHEDGEEVELRGVDIKPVPSTEERELQPFGDVAPKWLAFARSLLTHRWLPPSVYAASRRLKRLAKAAIGRRPAAPPEASGDPPLELGSNHVAFTSVFNPLDGRKAWRETLGAFLHSLGSKPDATLLLKFVCSPAAAAEMRGEVQKIVQAYGRRMLRSRVIAISEALSDAAMHRLARATNWYVNGSRAEGCCLPLLEMMAFGRPAISPMHTAMTDYFSGQAGLVVDSEQVPTDWPGHATGEMNTTWAALSWTSLCQAFDRAYEMSRTDRDAYETLANRASASAWAWAGAEAVERRLRRALATMSEAPTLAEAA